MVAWLALAWAAYAEPPAAVVVRDEDAATYTILGGKGQATPLLHAGNGSPAASLGRLLLAPGAEVPAHTHDNSAELLLVEEGRVAITVAGRQLEAGPGDAIYIPAGAEHAARVTSTVAAARLVQIYVGPGPEQRFTAGAKATAE